MINGKRFTQAVRDLIQMEKNASEAEAILATALEAVKVKELRIKEIIGVETDRYYLVREHDHYGDTYSVYIDEDGETSMTKLADPLDGDDEPMSAPPIFEPPLMTAPKVDVSDVPF